jgi:hypothetical protein
MTTKIPPRRGEISPRKRILEIEGEIVYRVDVQTDELEPEFAKAKQPDGLARSVDASGASIREAAAEWAPSGRRRARARENASTTILMLARISRGVNGLAFHWIVAVWPIVPVPLCASRDCVLRR